MITSEDYYWFVERSLDHMVEIVLTLGDEGANTRPELPGANSPYAILTHCLGVMSWWGGHVVAGRTVERDRDAEFQARGSVLELTRRVIDVKARFAEDLAEAKLEESPRTPVAPQDAVLPLGRTQGGALFHIYEELSQHLGQMELTRDIIRATQ